MLSMIVNSTELKLFVVDIVEFNSQKKNMHVFDRDSNTTCSSQVVCIRQRFEYNKYQPKVFVFNKESKLDFVNYFEIV